MDSNTCLKDTAAPCVADTNNEEPNLVAGRLKLIPANYPIDAGSPSERTTSSYGISRLGIVPESEFAESEFATTKERRKSTFKLSVGLLDRLRNYATTAGQYQYAIVTQALEKLMGLESADSDSETVPLVWPDSPSPDSSDSDTADDQHQLERDLAATREALERTKARLKTAESQLLATDDSQATPQGNAKLDASGFLGMLLAALWYRS